MKMTARKPRIALMTSAIDGRMAKGTAIVARKCVEALLEHRDEFELTFIHYEKCDDPIYRHGVREVILPEFRSRFLNRRSIRQIYYFLTTQDSFDIIHWFQPRVYPFFWRAPARHIVVTVHGAGDLGKENHFVLSRLIFNGTLKLFKSRVAIAIVGSHYARNDIITQYGFSPAQARVIHNGVDPLFSPASAQKVESVKKRYHLPDTFFLNVGRLIPGKNVLRVLRAFERFCFSFPESTIHFVNIGAKGSEKPLIDELIDKSRFKDRIHLVGYVEEEDLPAVYTAGFALVFPLLNEGFGLPVIEAMACGTPAIISQTATPEFTDRDAILVDALSEESIASGMREMASNPPLRNTLIGQSLACAKRFSWDETGSKLITIYKEIVR